MSQEHIPSPVLDYIQRQSSDWLDSLNTTQKKRFEESMKRLAQLTFPDRRHESFRYTPLQWLKAQDWDLLSSIFLIHREDEEQQLQQAADYLRTWLNDHGFSQHARIVFVNGKFDESLSQWDQGVLTWNPLDNLSQDESCHAIYDDWHLSDQKEDDFFIGLSTLACLNPVEIIFEQSIDEEPVLWIELITNTAQYAISSARHLIHLKRKVKVNCEHFVLTCQKQEGETFVNNCWDFVLSPEACLTLKTTIAGDPMFYESCGMVPSYGFDRQRFRLKEKSQLVHRNLSILPQFWRCEVAIDLEEPEARCELLGGTIVHQDHYSDMHAYIHHNVADTVSSQIYKALCLDSGQSVFNGCIYVHQDAQRVKAHQLNNNWLLGAKAKAYTKPELFIDADDVECSHGATVGGVDVEALFYLQSRGLDKKRSQTLLAKGFLHEVALPRQHQLIEQALNIAMDE